MAVIGRVRTTEDSIRLMRIEYPWLVEAEVLQSIAVEVTPEGSSYDPDKNLIIDSVGLDVTRTQVNFRVLGGEEGGLYNVRFIVGTSAGQQNEDCIEFTVDAGCQQ